MKKYINCNNILKDHFEKWTNAAINLENAFFLNWSLIVSMLKQRKIYKQRNRYFKIHKQTKSYYS